MSWPARLLLITVCVLGLGVAIVGVAAWAIASPVKFFAYLLTAVIASRLKVELPEGHGSMSVSFLFILISIAELDFTETLVLGCCAILVQCYISRDRWPKLKQVLFNVSGAAVAISAAFFIYHGPLRVFLSQAPSLLLVFAGCVYFV